jgi:uncharacterized spore protein YtfJ
MMIGEQPTNGTPAETPLPSGRTDALLDTLAERVGGHFGAASVFGTPVEREGVTVVPVATVRFGFGGGSGSDPEKRQEGEGAGAGGTMAGAGYIELKDGRSRFVPIVRPERMVALALAAALLALAVARRAPARSARGCGPAMRRFPGRR